MADPNNFLSEMGFSKEVQQRFSSMGQEILIKKGDKLLRQGEVCSFIAIIISGLFKIYHEDDGKELSIGLRYNGFVSDYSSFVTRLPSEVNIMAYSDCKLIYMEKDEIEVFFNYDIDTQKFGRHMAEQLMVANQNTLFSFLYDSAEERYNKIGKQTHLLYC